MSEIEDIQQKIKDVKHEISYVKTSLDDVKRRYERDKDLIWEGYRQKSDELERKVSDARGKMNYFENEIEWRKDKIRELENQNREQERIFSHSNREIDQMRDDDIPDGYQAYDIMLRGREADLADRQKELNDNDIRRYEEEINDFNNRYYSTESDIGDYDGQQEALRQENRDRLYQAKIYYKDLSEADRQKMRDLLHQLDILEDELNAAYQRAHLREKEQKSEHTSESYNFYINDKFLSDDNDYGKRERDDGADGTGYTLADFAGRPQEEFDESSLWQKDDDVETYYKPAQEALKSYAKSKKTVFQETVGRQGYQASVGKTDYNYLNKNKVEIISRDDNNQKSVPSVEDFVMALLVEKNNGKNVVTISKADSDEYRARLMIACQKVGLRTRGYTKIEDVDNLDEDTCEMLKSMPSAEKNKELLERLRQRKSKKAAVVSDRLLQMKKDNYSR